MRVKLPALHTAQRTVWDDPARFQVLVGGRRLGKSKLGSLKCISEAIQRKRYWWVWPNYPNASVGWRMLKTLAAQVPGAEKKEVERIITFPGGGFCQVKSADKPDSLRSEGLDGVIVDEVAHIRHWDQVWEQALRPALSDRRGMAWFISTPKGYNHFFEMAQLERTDDNWKTHTYPTSSNPYIFPEEILAAKKLLPDLVFRQEYMAEFVQLAGALFKREYFNVLEEMPMVHRWVRSWDLAASTKTTASFTVGAKMGFTEDGVLAIADVVRGRWEWPDALKIIKDTALADGPEVTQGVEDVGTQKGMYQLLMREESLVGIPFTTVYPPADKITRAAPWLARAEQGKVALVRGAWHNTFLDEVCGFPEADHDDQVDAISGGVQMLGYTAGVPGLMAEAQSALARPSTWTGGAEGNRFARTNWG